MQFLLLQEYSKNSAKLRIRRQRQATSSGRSSSGDHWRVCLSSLCIISKVVLKAFHLTLETDRQISSKYDLALKSNQQPRASSTLPSL